MNRQFSTKIINFGFHQVELSELRPAMTSLGYETKNDTIFTMYDHFNLKFYVERKLMIQLKHVNFCVEINKKQDE